MDLKTVAEVEKRSKNIANTVDSVSVCYSVITQTELTTKIVFVISPACILYLLLILNLSGQ